MSNLDYYDIVRQKMVLGPLIAPKHDKIIELLRIFWNEEEIKILSHFKKADEWTSLKELQEKTRLSRDEIKGKLNRLVEMGTISKHGLRYCLDPLIPGIFEKYFQRSVDTEENIKKVAQIYRDIMKEIIPYGNNLNDKNWKLLRPLLPLDSNEKLIEINKDFDVEAQTLPYESVKNLIDKYDTFAVVTCPCRLIGELSGEPCEIAPAEIGCFMAGPASQLMVDRGLRGARNLNKEEAIEFIKDTEKRGLVHNAVFDRGSESSVFICNCCSCHCGSIYPAKILSKRGTHQSNYSPIFNNELCTKCETCIKKCPMDAIFHHQAIESDPVEKLAIREDLCIGCGICAANCPNNAIKMIKVRDIIPPKLYLIGNKTVTNLMS